MLGYETAVILGSHPAKGDHELATAISAMVIQTRNFLNPTIRENGSDLTGPELADIESHGIGGV